VKEDNPAPARVTGVERIDAHHHLWKYYAEDYPWMLEGMESIRRDFLTNELHDVRREARIDGFIAVQARQTLRETDWLLELAASHAVLRGVVGWVPLTDSTVGSVLERYSTNPKLKGVRHVLHDEPDEFYMLREDFNAGIDLLKQFALPYDLLIFERHLPQTITFVDRHPDQVFVLDHIGKPRIRDHVLSPWREHIAELAKRKNVYCKLSGLVTEANWIQWDEAELQPYIDIVLEQFGPEHVMFGSDWPVLLVACGYKAWFDIVARATSGLSSEDKNAILGGTAKRVYGC
jgi:L-fuconolactonase